MTDASREHIRMWLRDAHAMEEQAERLFSSQAESMRNFPDVKNKLLLELDSIKKHQEMLSIRIQQLGSAPSLFKSMEAKLSVGVQNLMGMFMESEPVQTMLSLYMLTYFALGSYRILIVAALEVNDEETFKVCKAIHNRTEIRALWLEDQLAVITRRSLDVK